MSDILKSTSFISAVLSECESTPQVVLDINPGWHTIELSRRLPQSQIVGLGAFFRFNEIAREGWNGLEDTVSDNLSVIHGCFEELPFEDGTFDLLLFVSENQNELPRAECLEKGLKEMGRVMMVEGMSIINFSPIVGEETRLDKKQSDSPGEKEIISLLNKAHFLNHVEIVKKELNLGIAFKRIR